MKYVSPEDVATANLARWGLYGLNGAGKTTFLASVRKRMLVISADDENVKPLIGRKNIKIAKITRWEDIADIYADLRAGLANPDVVAGRKPFFEVVAFDTFSRLQALAANMIVKYEPLGPDEVAKFAKVAPRLPKGYESWQQIGALAGEWLRYFERLPLHLIVLFQEQKREPKEGAVLSEPVIGPAVTPEALKSVMDTLEIVGRLYVETRPIPREVKPNGSSEGGIEALTKLEDLDVEPARAGLTIDRDVEEVRYLLVGQRRPFLTKGPTHKLGYVVTNPTWDTLAVTLAPEAAPAPVAAS